MTNYRKKRAPYKIKNWEYCYVVSKKTICNGLGEMPKGTIFIITCSGITKYLQSLPCEKCGFVFKVTTKKARKDFLLNYDFIEEV